MNTLILTCSTGQGHNSCANALKEYYDSLHQPCLVEETLDFISPTVSRLICRGHVFMYRHVHGLFQIGYRYSERHSGLFQEDSPFCALLRRGTGNLRRYLLQHRIDTVICTHVFASLMMTQLQQQAPLPLRIGLVATDYTCNPGTRESVADLYFIPDPPLSVSYACPNIPDSHLISSGIPIRQMFYRRLSACQAKQALGISPSTPHLLMMCGSMGCGPIRALAARLVRQLPENAALTIVCGTNRRLQEKLENTYASSKNVRIFGYVQDVSALMDSADLYLTKPGGISVTEAAAKALPMVFIDAVAGCEEYNKIYFIKNGGARTAPSVSELAQLCIALLQEPDTLEEMRRCLRKTVRDNASAVIYNEMKNMERSQYEPAKTRC